MKILFKLSCWAKQHPWPSRIIIVLSHLLLTFFAIKTGSILYAKGITVPGFLFLGAGLLFGLALMGYPTKTGGESKFSKWQLYKRRKIADLTLISTTFIMMLLLGNNISNKIILPIENIFGTKAMACYVKVNGQAIEQPEVNNGDPAHTNKFKFGLKEKRNNIKAKLGTFFDENDGMVPGGKTGLGILLIIGSIGLIFLIAALACELSCSGAEGAAVLVGVLGAAGVVFLIVKAIQMMGRKSKTITHKK